MRRTIFIALIFLTVVVPLYAQQVEIEGQEYYQAVKSAGAKGRAYTYSKVTKREYFAAGKATDSNEDIEEHIPPNRTRYVQIRNKNGKVNRAEVITIGKTYYCKTDDASWTSSTQYCGPSSLYSIPYPPKSKKFWREKVQINGRRATLYIHRTEYMDKTTLRFWQDKEWVDDKGRAIREEIEHGTAESENIAVSGWVPMNMARKA